MASDAKVLILEDHDQMRELLTQSLEEEGYQTTGASSALEALRAAGQTTFDLVISDVRMAGMDGLGALEALKSRTPGLKCIVITGFADDDAPGRAVRIGVDDYLYKPFGLRHLLESVERVLGSGLDQAGYRQLVGLLGSPPEDPLGGSGSPAPPVAGQALLQEAEANLLASNREEAYLTALEQARMACVQAIFVGIRSRLLTPSEAMQAWDRLEALEEQQDRLDPEELSSCQDLIAAYRALFNLLASMTRGQSAGSAPERLSGQVTRQDFQRLFERVAQASVTPEQLSIAGLLRRTNLQQLTQSPELLALYRTLWG